MLEEFKAIDFPKLICSDNELLREALIEMCKQLIGLFTSSLPVLEICTELIQYGMNANVDKECYLNLWLVLI